VGAGKCAVLLLRCCCELLGRRDDLNDDGVADVIDEGAAVFVAALDFGLILTYALLSRSV
jgi:hypothetical protein